jgi:hypothetical protein
MARPDVAWNCRLRRLRYDAFSAACRCSHRCTRGSSQTVTLNRIHGERSRCGRKTVPDNQYKATFDLTGSAVAFTLFHEFRHVMLDRDGKRPADRPEEELACDVWAREFVTVTAAAYAASKGLTYAEVLQRRSMSFVLAALILHEITPIWGHGGNGDYFSVAVRMETILKNTRLPPNSHFWNFAAAVLIGMCRQKHIPFDPPAMSAQALTDYLVGLV